MGANFKGKNCGYKGRKIRYATGEEMTSCRYDGAVPCEFRNTTTKTGRVEKICLRENSKD